MRVKIESEYPLARLTTVRTGGSAEYFCTVESKSDLTEALAWATERGLAVAVAGSGSNLLVADSGVAGLVIKFGRELSNYSLECDHQIYADGGARLPSVAAFAARSGLTGIEFGVNIPGTVGGAVKMNANAYGGELAKVLSWVEVTTAKGTQRRTPDSFDFTYRSSNLKQAEVVSAALFNLAPSTPEQVKAETGRLRDKRKSTQPSGIKTFGSTFKNPDDQRAEGKSAGQLLDSCGCQGLSLGGVRFSPKHANFIENTGEGTTEDVLKLMAIGRRKVYEQFGVELEPEVQMLGEITLPDEWNLAEE